MTVIVDEFYSNKRELNVFEWSFTCVCDFPSFIIAPYNPNNIHCDDPFSLFYDPSIEANQQTEVNLFNLYKSNILRIEHAKRMFGSLTSNERLIYLVFCITTNFATLWEPKVPGYIQTTNGIIRPENKHVSFLTLTAERRILISLRHFRH